MSIRLSKYFEEILHLFYVSKIVNLSIFIVQNVVTIVTLWKLLHATRVLHSYYGCVITELSFQSHHNVVINLPLPIKQNGMYVHVIEKKTRQVFTC